MKLLIRLRPFELLSFAMGLLTIIYSAANRDEVIYLLGAALSFWGITAFLVTEAFGELANERSSFSRWVARIFLVLSSFVSVSVLYIIIRWGVHSVSA